MYIVNKGLLQVEVDGHIVTTLSAGNHFGEISILDIEGVGNRRTASIHSLGFSQLFKLSKIDLQEVSTYHCLRIKMNSLQIKTVHLSSAFRF